MATRGSGKKEEFRFQIMSQDIYSTSKVNYHPYLVEAFCKNESHKLNPVFVHLMPQNLCNQDCHFCSYRLENWKNSEIFNTKLSIPWPKMEEILEDLQEMSVKAIEITGGGEPLAYPHINQLLDGIAERGFEVGLVTNATLLKEDRADKLFNTNFKWARVSIDAGTEETYCSVRRVPKHHWNKVWDGAKRAIDRREKGKHIIGAGFVVTDMNWLEVKDGILRMAEFGFDNVRVSYAFTPKGDKLIDEGQIQNVQDQIRSARDEVDEDFHIADLFTERLFNQKLSPKQDYDYCGTKDLLCVIEGECNVYTCCTLTGTPSGLIGNIAGNIRFKELWEKTKGWRKNFNVRKRCQCACLYEKRNMAMLKLMNPPDHLNFI